MSRRCRLISVPDSVPVVVGVSVACHDDGAGDRVDHVCQDDGADGADRRHGSDLHPHRCVRPHPGLVYRPDERVGPRELLADRPLQQPFGSSSVTISAPGTPMFAAPCASSCQLQVNEIGQALVDAPAVSGAVGVPLHDRREPDEERLLSAPSRSRSRFRAGISASRRPSRTLSVRRCAPSSRRQ